MSRIDNSSVVIYEGVNGELSASLFDTDNTLIMDAIPNVTSEEIKNKIFDRNLGKAHFLATGKIESLMQDLAIAVKELAEINEAIEAKDTDHAI